MPQSLRFLLFIILFLRLSVCSAQTDITTIGKDFWFSFSYAGYGINATNALTVFISSEVTTSGTISVPLQGWSQSFVVVPSVTTTIVIPNEIAENLGSNVIEPMGVHVETENNVSVYCINYDDYQTDGTRILPTSFTGTNYMAMAYVGYDEGFYDYYSQVLIVASADDTEVEITPTANVANGVSAGTTYTVSLQAGESYLIQGVTVSDDFTGTTINATAASGECRPFSVFGGSQCTNVPTSCSACDHLFDQSFPIEIWEYEFLMAPFQGSSSYTYRVLALEDNTDVSIDGVPTYTLNSGEFVEVNYETQALYISANKPINPVQYMQGQSCSGYGDPAMFSLNAINQTIDQITFSTVSSNILTDHNINVITASAFTDQVYLDGAFIPSTSFTPFPGYPEYSYALVDITTGSHTLSCIGGVTAYIYGAGTNESYAYPAGSKSTTFPEIPINTECTNDQVVLAVDPPYFNSWWSTEAAPEDTLFVGDAFVINPPILTELYVLHGESLISGCPQETTFSVESPGEILVDIGVASLNLCFLQEHQFNAMVDPPSAGYEYAWTPAAAFDDPTLPNAALTANESGWYFLDVSTLSGCSYGTDSVYVEVTGGMVSEYNAQADPEALCIGDAVQLDVQVEQIVLSASMEVAPPAADWSDVQGSVLGSSCGSVSGNAIYFTGGTDRYCETVDLDLTGGGSITFALQISNGSDGCDGTEIGEDVLLEYSTNGGASWTNISTFFESMYPVFTSLNVPIPAAAQTAATRLRWIQPSFSAADEDVWMLDNVVVATLNENGLNFSWTSNEPVDNPSVSSTSSIPQNSGYFYVSSTLNDCQYTDSIYVTVSTGFTLEMTNDTSLCDISGIQLFAQPLEDDDYTFVWTESASLNNNLIYNPIATPTTDETFFVEVTNSAGCTINESVNIVVSGLMDLNLSTPTSSICLGEVAVLTANVTGTSDPLSYSWSPSAFVDNIDAATTNANLLNTSYVVVEVTNLNSNCALNDSILIAVDDIELDLPAELFYCGLIGNSIDFDFNASSSYTYLWDNNTDLNDNTLLYPTFTNDDFSGLLTLTVTNTAIGCSASDGVMINNTSAAYNNDEVIVHCPGVPISSNFSGDYVSITWDSSPFLDDTDPENPIFSNTAAEIYYFTLEFDNGCTIADQIQVDVTLIGAAVNYGVLCEGQTTVLTVEASGMNYLWNTGETTQSITVDAGGTYTVEISDADGCLVDVSVDVTQYPTPVFEIVGTPELCIGLTSNLSVPLDNVSYDWTTGSQSSNINVTVNGVYGVTVTNEFGCEYSDQMEVTFVGPPDITLSVDGFICDDFPTNVHAVSNAASIVWNTGQTTENISTNVPGYYVLTASQGGNCVTVDSILVEQIILPPSPVADTSFCFGKYVDLSLEQIPGYAYYWSSGDAGLQTTYYDGGTQWLTLTTENCIKDYPFEITIHPLPEIQFEDPGVFCELDLFGADFILRAFSQDLLVWEDGSSGEEFLIQHEGIYHLTAISEFGCLTTDSIEIVSLCDPYIFIPNSFTPNNDGVNDVFEVIVSGILDHYELMIFDRWGEKVFHSRSVGEVWQGNMNGGEHYLPDGVYSYVMSYTATSRVDHVVSEKLIGHVNLIR